MQLLINISPTITHINI